MCVCRLELLLSSVDDGEEGMRTSAACPVCHCMKRREDESDIREMKMCVEKNMPVCVCICLCCLCVCVFMCAFKSDEGRRSLKAQNMGAKSIELLEQDDGRVQK